MTDVICSTNFVVPRCQKLDTVPGSDAWNDAIRKTDTACSLHLIGVSELEKEISVHCVPVRSVKTLNFA